MKNTSKNTTSNQSLLQFFDDLCMVFVKSNSWNTLGGSDCFPFTRFFGAGFGDCLSGAAGDAACLLPLAALSSTGAALLFAAPALA